MPTLNPAVTQESIEPELTASNTLQSIYFAHFFTVLRGGRWGEDRKKI